MVGTLLNAGIEDERIEEALNVLLWFGFLGVVRPGGAELYSHNVQFNSPRLRDAVGMGAGSFIIHPAFRAGLDIQH